MINIKQILKSIALNLVEKFFFIVFLPVWIIVSLAKRQVVKNTSPKLVWGPVAILNYKYWSYALRKCGYDSTTIVDSFTQHINKKEDYDLYTQEISKWLATKIKKGGFLAEIAVVLLPFWGFTYIITNYDILHYSFLGGYLGQTKFWRAEAHLLKLAGCKIVIHPIGLDAYLYSEIINFSLRHVLLLSLPNFAKQEEKIKLKVKYWQNHADIIATGYMVDGISKWDLLPYNSITIDCDLWQEKTQYSQSDGINGIVKIIHTPNFRGYKGTEFVIQAIEDLKAEGLKVELLLIEKTSNDEVKRLMQEEADILVEQLIMGYALTAIEGMASGLPVLSNLDNEEYTRLFRRYSYLNECPILSTTPENIKDNLRVLITNPQLRKELGNAGRKYVEKYHSEATAQYMFGAIYDKIWHGKEVDLMNLFHPLKSQYNRSTPFVAHPLFENRLPEYYYKNIANSDKLSPIT